MASEGIDMLLELLERKVAALAWEAPIITDLIMLIVIKSAPSAVYESAITVPCLCRAAGHPKGAELPVAARGHVPRQLVHPLLYVLVVLHQQHPPTSTS